MDGSLGGITSPFLVATFSLAASQASSVILSSSCQSAYWLWLVVIALLMVPGCIKDLKDMGMMQLVMTGIGYVCIAAMMSTTLWAMYHTPLKGVHDPKSGPPYVAHQDLVQLSGFGLLFSTTIFTQMCHIAVPTLTHVIKNKSDIQRVLVGGMTTTFIMYTVLGVCTNPSPKPNRHRIWHGPALG